eukprot:559515-Pleurochrysis_carterae.AAC.2
MEKGGAHETGHTETLRWSRTPSHRRMTLGYATSYGSGTNWPRFLVHLNQSVFLGDIAPESKPIIWLAFHRNRSILLCGISPESKRTIRWHFTGIRAYYWVVFHLFRRDDAGSDRVVPLVSDKQLAVWQLHDRARAVEKPAAVAVSRVFGSRAADLSGEQRDMLELDIWAARCAGGRARCAARDRIAVDPTEA